MKTVQRSPSRVGAVEERASWANSPLMLTPSLSACSSRNEPVPAAQASFMAKSTTTPFSIEMNLESCPPISKIVSTGSEPCEALMCRAPVLWAVISSLTTSAPTSSAISSRPEPVVPTPSITRRRPHSRSISARPCWTASIGPPGGAQVDVLDHAAPLVHRHHVGRHRTDVDAEESGNGLVARRGRIALLAVAEQDHVLHGQRRHGLHAALPTRAGSAGGCRGKCACGALRSRASRCPPRRTRRTAPARSARLPCSPKASRSAASRRCSATPRRSGPPGRSPSGPSRCCS